MNLRDDPQVLSTLAGSTTHRGGELAALLEDVLFPMQANLAARGPRSREKASERIRAEVRRFIGPNPYARSARGVRDLMCRKGHDLKRLPSIETVQSEIDELKRVQITPAQSAPLPFRPPNLASIASTSPTT